MRKDVIARRIKTLEKKYAEILKIMDAKPGSDLISLYQQTAVDVKGKTPAEALKILSEIEIKEKKILAIAKKQADPNIVSERVRLDSEIAELKSELFYIERGKYV